MEKELEPGSFFLLARCSRCGVVFYSGWSEGFQKELYEYYRERADLPRDKLYDRINDTRYNGILNDFSRRVSAKRLLDVGCGQGQFVDAALRRGWDALGIDLSPEAVALCKQAGVPALHGDIHMPMLCPGTFDVITLFEVIEHIWEPHGFLNRCAKLLKPGGILYITTPNFNSLDRRVLGSGWRVIHPEHLIYFTPATLARFVSDNKSFTLLSLSSSGISNTTLRKIGIRLGATTADERENDQFARQTIESSSVLRLIKGMVNAVLSLTGTGSTITMMCRKKR
jgi:SAM-dependent methyltransferase